MSCEAGAVDEEFEKDDGLLNADVPPNTCLPAKVVACGVMALGMAAKEKGLKASEVEPNEGASPVNSNGIAYNRCLWQKRTVYGGAGEMQMCLVLFEGAKCERVGAGEDGFKYCQASANA